MTPSIWASIFFVAVMDAITISAALAVYLLIDDVEAERGGR